jgi:hypothetical protein
LLEFVFGGNPGLAEGSKVQSAVMPGHVFQVAFPRSDQCEGDLRLLLEYTDDPAAAWNEFDIGPVGSSSGDIDCAVEERGSQEDWITVSISMALHSVRFVRLVAQQF